MTQKDTIHEQIDAIRENRELKSLIATWKTRVWIIIAVYLANLVWLATTRNSKSYNEGRLHGRQEIIEQVESILKSK